MGHREVAGRRDNSDNNENDDASDSMPSIRLHPRKGSG